MKKEGSEKERCFKTDLSQSNVGSEKTSSGELFLFVLSFFSLWGRRARADGTNGDVGTGPHQVLAATLTLFQSEGADYADHILMSPPCFESHRLQL